MVIRSVRRRGRLTAKEQIMQSERESSSKSHFFKTSLKKLGPLARQIAGKNIDDAILQMRFSKKKAAKDVKAFLEHAKNEAIVSRGMGLGRLPTQSETSEQTDASTTATSTPANTASPLHLRLKDGTRHTVTDPTSIYISQAWVGRGPFGKELSHRGRGNIHILRPPHTSVSVVLKEEKTRIREWREREEKLIRQRRTKVWRQLPDRKVTMRNQFYAW
ncbi:39S ribosomal protein L22, mitochondrial [Ophidiomyces ophidiicola]|nr:39S ribosomal protein L22, mitochondrial [Ophidiomyces ophidiicola]